MKLLNMLENLDPNDNEDRLQFMTYVAILKIELIYKV